MHDYTGITQAHSSPSRWPLSLVPRPPAADRLDVKLIAEDVEHRIEVLYHRRSIAPPVEQRPLADGGSICQVFQGDLVLVYKLEKSPHQRVRVRRVDALAPGGAHHRLGAAGSHGGAGCWWRNRASRAGSVTWLAPGPGLVRR